MLSLGHISHLVRVREKIMFWLKIPALVATDTAGDVSRFP